MNLYLQIKDGQPYQHPVPDWNLQMFIPDMDVDVPPKGFVKFVRVPIPQLGPFEVYEGTTYEPVDDYYTDVHHIRDMTEEERANKLQQFKSEYPAPFPSWVFNEETLKWMPPVPYPNDDKSYIWDEELGNWKNESDFYPPSWIYDETKKLWHPPSWAWNESKNTYLAPVIYPNDNEIYKWDDQTNNWVLWTDVPAMYNKEEYLAMMHNLYYE